MNDLPRKWAEATLADVTLPYDTIDPTQFPTRGFQYIDIGAINNRTHTITDPKSFLGRDAPSRARRVVQSGDVLFSTVRTYLKNIAIVPEELDGQLTSTGVAVLRASQAVEGGYLFNFVRSDEFTAEISKAQDGTLYPAISDRTLGAATISLPPLAEQRRINAKVNGLTTRIARARSALGEIPSLVTKYRLRMLELAAAGELTKDWRTEAGAEDWRSTTVENVAEAIFDGPFGSNLKSADYTSDGVRVVRLENIGFLNFFSEKETYISKEKFESLKRNLLFPNDILFSAFVQDEIRVCLFPDDLRTLAINKADCFCVRIIDTVCLPEFLAFKLSSPSTYEALRGEVHGATRPRINLTHLRNLELHLPSLAEQAEIVRRLDASFERLNAIDDSREKASRLLDKLESAVLTKAMKGQLVPQSAHDKPASIMLAQTKLELLALQQGKQRRKRPLKPPQRKSMSEPGNLKQVLKEAKGWLPAQMAFEQCGIGDGASTEMVEHIYGQLRELDRAGRVEIEAITDESGRKLYDRIRLKDA